MQKLDTYFEQVPLEKVEAILQEELKRQEEGRIQDHNQPSTHSRSNERLTPMDSPFDIFRAEDGGTLLWRGAAETLEHAKNRVKELAQNAPAEYVIVNIRTGLQLKISAGEMDGDGAKSQSGGSLEQS